MFMNTSNLKLEKENQEFVVSKKLLMAAYEASSPEDKRELEEQYPEIFKYTDLFEFDVRKTYYDLTTHCDDSHPIYIGKYSAPKGLYGKCLLVTYDWKAEILDGYSRQQVIIFKKRK